MTTVAPADVQVRLGELLARVANGESIAITEAGKPVALLVPPPALIATTDAEDGKPESRDIRETNVSLPRPAEADARRGRDLSRPDRRRSPLSIEAVGGLFVLIDRVARPSPFRDSRQG